MNLDKYSFEQYVNTPLHMYIYTCMYIDVHVMEVMNLCARIGLVDQLYKLWVD